MVDAETVPINTSFVIIKDAFLLRCKLGKTIISIRAIWYNNYQSKCVKVKRAFNARAFLQHYYLELKLLRGITKTDAIMINRFLAILLTHFMKEYFNSFDDIQFFHTLSSISLDI